MQFLYETVVILIIIKIILKLTNGICKSHVCLVGKTALVTGGNKGIGYETALGLAARGCRVIIASRTSSEDVKNDIIKHTNNPNIVAKILDLGSLDCIRKFAEEFNKTEDRLDILVNNAGVGNLKNKFTKDGLHEAMQTNHFGPFLLTHLLTGLLKKSAPSRIIFVSSVLAFANNLTNTELLNNPLKDCTDDDRIGFTRVYANSKLCNIITSNEFAEKLKEFGVTSNSLHPGTVLTNIFQKSFDGLLSDYGIRLFYLFLGFFFKSPYEGAQVSLHLALSKKMEKITGQYFLDCISFFVPKRTKDKEFCRQVWTESEKLVKLKPEEKI